MRLTGRSNGTSILIIAIGRKGGGVLRRAVRVAVRDYGRIDQIISFISNKYSAPAGLGYYRIVSLSRLHSVDREVEEVLDTRTMAAYIRRIRQYGKESPAELWFDSATRSS